MALLQSERARSQHSPRAVGKERVGVAGGVDDNCECMERRRELDGQKLRWGAEVEGRQSADGEAAEREAPMDCEVNACGGVGGDGDVEGERGRRLEEQLIEGDLARVGAEGRGR